MEKLLVGLRYMGLGLSKALGTEGFFVEIYIELIGFLPLCS